MNEAYLQILLILAYLAIGLIAITFPIHALCITYLRQEKWETEKEGKKRRKKLSEIIDKLNKDLSGQKKDSDRFEEIQTQIQGNKAELKALKLRIGHLTAWGAVGRPVSIFSLALICAIVGIFYFYAESELVVVAYMFGSGSISAFGIIRLFHIITIVESASLRPAHTIEFQVHYGSGEKSEKIKLKKPTHLDMSAGTEDEDMEYFEINVIFPPEISIVKIESRDAYGSIQPKSSDYPDYVMLTKEKNFVAKNTAVGISVMVSANKIGKFLIPVDVAAKGVYAYKTKLTLVVVK